MRKSTKQKNLLMTALVKIGWELSLSGEDQDKLWAQYGRRFAIRLRSKTFTLYKKVDDDFVEVETLDYNRRQSQQIKRLIAKHN